MKVNLYARLLASTVLIILPISGCENLMKPPHIFLAAGKRTGESYIISAAIARVAKKKSGIDIEVCSTDGTKENLELLQHGYVELVTAQSDYASEKVGIPKLDDDTISTQISKESCRSNSVNHSKTNTLVAPKTVAVLYRDFFHLLVKDPKVNKLSQLYKRKVILDIPREGGQIWSFKKVIEYEYGIKDKDIDKYFSQYITIKNKSDISSKNACKADIVFRVRALDNQEINNFIQNNCGRLLPIEQALAMKVKHPAFIPDNIPTGTYRPQPPEPNAGEKGLNTVSVLRLLLASEKVDKRIIEEISRIIFENRQDIVNAISEIQEEDTINHKKLYDYQYIKPLIRSISRPNDIDNQQIAIPIHPGALDFYNQNNDLWKKLNDNGNVLNFIVAFAAVIIAITPGMMELLLWWLQRPQKKEVDKYINEANELIKQETSAGHKQKQLDEVFGKIVIALRENKISQESFLTFNEAYKRTREAIERERQLEIEIDSLQRKNEADRYINQVIKLMNKDEDDIESRQKRLDEEFNKAAKALIDGDISHGSFRTFSEAYTTTREALEHERQLALIKKAQEQRKTSENYVTLLAELLRDEVKSQDLLVKKLDEIFHEVVTKLTEQKISEESFRTFVDVYTTTKDAIERRRSTISKN